MAKKLSDQPQKIIKMARRQQQQHQPSQIEDKPNFDIPSGKYFEGLGRRKMATARVRIYEEKNGQCVVNDQLAKDYFSGIYNAVKVYTQPFELTGTQEKFAVTVKVDGSGINSQLEAIVHGLTRALVKYDESFKPLLKQEGLLTRDARMKETRKPGRGGKARRKRQSPKR